ncbi:hypothetical protein BHE74_00036426 [Ensete ventricosum]|nr:hypothetical protein BHE74_00036426 [Ensete ventricosum]
MESRTNMVSGKNMTVINFARSRRIVEYRSILSAPSRKLKILTNPDVLAHGKSYEHGFGKEHDGHKFCAKSRA